jgi:hypothetical protein
VVGTAHPTLEETLAEEVHPATRQLYGPEDFLGLRWQVEAELDRLGLSWKSERVVAYIRGCCGPRGILADMSARALASLLARVREAK